MIRVIMKNFEDTMIDEHMLDPLIDGNKLIGFYRSNECVVIGKDAVREQNTFYHGEERRKIICGNDFFMK